YWNNKNKKELILKLHLQKQFDQERKAVDDIDWSKIVEQAQERQSRSMIRYQALKKKPVTVAQARKNMMVYLKNMANYKMKYLKGMSYDQIRPIFEEEYRKVQTLLKKDSEVSKLEKKRVAEEALLQESFKKLRTAKASGSEPFHQEKSTEEPKELSEEDLKKMLEIVLVEEFRVEALVGNITEAYQGFKYMLKAFDREDLDTLWSLVKEKFRSTEPTKDMEKSLWVEFTLCIFNKRALHLYVSRKGLSFDNRSYDVDAQQKTASRRRYHEGYRNAIELPEGAKFFPPERNAKLRNDILMFQQHQGESLYDAWNRFKDSLQKVPHHGLDLWLQVQIFYDHVNYTTQMAIDDALESIERRVESLMRSEVLLYYEEGFMSTKRPYQEKLEARILKLIDDQEDQIRQLEEDIRKTTDTFMCLANSLIATLKVKIEAQRAHSMKIEKITRILTHAPTVTPKILKPTMSHRENKLEYEDEDEVEINMTGTGMDKESMEHNLDKDDITLIVCHNFSLTLNPPIKAKDLGSFRIKVVEPLIIHTPPSPHVTYFYSNGVYRYSHPHLTSSVGKNHLLRVE
ncbi:hypothetical protein Tco_1287326, partial [Tanacetum coccineum]